jgi:hypothetical protein
VYQYRYIAKMLKIITVDRPEDENKRKNNTRGII